LVKPLSEPLARIHSGMRASDRASMIYQHAVADRDQELAERIGAHYTKYANAGSAEVRSLGA
jgi:hypothetical protein